MKKYTSLSIVLFFALSFSAPNVSYSFSVPKLLKTSEALKYVKASEFVKLSFEQYAALTGKKQNLWNNLSFNALKMQVKHDLKKKPDLLLSDYTTGKTKHHLATIWWILIGLAALFLILWLVAALVIPPQ